MDKTSKPMVKASGLLDHKKICRIVDLLQFKKT